MTTTYFSNSLKIHQVRTKQITAVKEVWIPRLREENGKNYYTEESRPLFKSLKTLDIYEFNTYLTGIFKWDFESILSHNQTQ